MYSYTIEPSSRAGLAAGPVARQRQARQWPRWDKALFFARQWRLLRTVCLLVRQAAWRPARLGYPMVQILALETTARPGSVAAAEDCKLLCHFELSRQQRTAQSLLPAIRSLLVQVGWRPQHVNLVAVSIGPGSFTGLRLGVTAAKLFAYATGADVLGIDTLETIAAGAPERVDRLAVAADAQRGEVIAAQLRRQADGYLRPTGPPQLMPVSAWLASLPPGIWVAGPVLDRLAVRLPEHVRLIDAQYWHPRAAAVARLAARDYQAGRRDDLWRLAPRYGRPSAAEEKRPE